MKSIFLAFLICISSLANAQSSKQRLENIEDKLDLIREEQEWREFDRIIKQDGYGNKSLSKFISNQSRYKLIRSTSISDVWFDEKFYKKTKNNSFDFSIEIEYKSPQKLNDGTLYQYALFSGSLYCNQNQVFVRLSIFRRSIDSEGALGQSQTFNIEPNTTWSALKKYRCL
jgi:hypothetical protein